VGNHCAGARINRKMVPIRTEIRMGDVVEILQSRSARPAPGWLDIVHTSRARSKVRYFLKSVDFDKNRQAGADALNRAIRARGLEIPPEELPDRLKKSLPSFKASTFEDLLSEIGFGSVSANSVAGRLVAEEKAPKKEKARPKPKDAAQEIIVEGLQNMMARIGMCCNPMPGENIVGFITRGRGVSVHRSDCPNLRSTLGSGDKSVSDRLVTVRWGAGDPALRRVLFRIHCNDRPGMLHDVSKVFTDLGINIVETNSKSNMRQKSAQLGITAQIGNAAQVNEAMVQLQRIYGVQTVTRSIRTS
jgi:GTP pyrophosphokinase